MLSLNLGCTDVIYLMSQAVPWTTAVMGVHTRPSWGQQTPPQGGPRVVSHCGLVRHTGGALALSCLPSSLPHRHHGDQAQRRFPTVTQNKGRLSDLPEKKPAAPSLWTLTAEECQAQQSTSHWTKGPGVSSARSGPVVDPLLTQTLVNAWFKSLN